MEYKFSKKMDNLKASAIREILKYTADPTVISFAAGNPAPEAFPVQLINDITKEIFATRPIDALQYSITEGHVPLREKLRVQMKERYNSLKEFDDVIVTTGAQQGIDLVCKVMCDKGDTILCESPSFVGSLNAFKSYEVNLVGVQKDDDGINIEKLERAIEENQNVKVLYLIPNFQNPTGTCMSWEKRVTVYEICKKHGIIILEDNPYGELRFAGENINTIKSIDTEGIVVYVGTFSKILSPGIRVGFLCGPKDILSKVVVVKQTNDVHTSILSQLICDSFLDKVDFDEHIDGLRKIYRQKSSLMLDNMKRKLNSKITFIEPEGGLFIWCTLPDNVNMMDFCKKAVANKVAVVPGTAFLISENDTTQSFRMNFSTPTNEQIEKGIGILGELTYDII